MDVTVEQCLNGWPGICRHSHGESVERINKIEQAKQTGKQIVGVALSSFCSTIAEAVGHFGMRFLFIDNEQNPQRALGST